MGESRTLTFPFWHRAWFDLVPTRQGGGPNGNEEEDRRSEGGPSMPPRPSENAVKRKSNLRVFTFYEVG